MGGSTAVYLISGFLGSGKTTFLNRIIHAFPDNRKLMILMNEFGEVGVDGPLVENDDLSMLEISRGSIFCVCVKTDFIKGLMNIARNIRPDVLIIEATGVANPSDLKRDLELSIFQERFHLREQFCIIDAVNFKDAYDTFASVEKQLESATVFIINKIDETDAGVIQQVKEIVGKHHPDPLFYETTYADIPFATFLPEVGAAETRDEPPDMPVSAQALEAVIDGLFQTPGIAMTPPDRLVSGTFLWKGSHPDQFEEMMKRIPAGMVRAKGIFETDTGPCLFNWVMGRGRVEKIDPKKRMAPIMNRIVFIGQPEAMEALGGIKLLERRPLA